MGQLEFSGQANYIIEKQVIKERRTFLGWRNGHEMGKKGEEMRNKFPGTKKVRQHIGYVVYKCTDLPLSWSNK